ncbi:MAG: hypothetical protein ACRCYY_01820 [Trueperaceae bacterium]
MLRQDEFSALFRYCEERWIDLELAFCLGQVTKQSLHPLRIL